MEIRLSSVLLAAALLSGCGWFHRGEKGPAPIVAEEPQAEPSIIEPQVNRRDVKTPKIKAKDFEVGAYFGALSIRTSAPIRSTACGRRTTCRRTSSWKGFS